MQPLAADDPRIIGPYRLLRRLGSGGMGRVYLGRSAGGRTVAVKVVHQHLAANDDFRARFRREVELARRVGRAQAEARATRGAPEPHGGGWTAPVLDADPEAELPWVASGYVAGPALQQAVEEHGSLPERAARAVGAGLAEGLAAIHQLALVHRDVKPSNVLLALDGPRLIDFGIARAVDGTSALTSTGVTIGSPGYMSPEQVLAREVGPPSDVFSLGAVLAFATTGHGPFPGNSSASLLYKVVHEEPELSGVTGELREVVAACLAKDPADRPTPGEVARRLSEGAGAEGLLGTGWLPAPLLEGVSRRAVELLDLDAPDPGYGPPTEPGARPAAGAASGPIPFTTPSQPGSGMSRTPGDAGAHEVPGAPAAPGAPDPSAGPMANGTPAGTGAPHRPGSGTGGSGTVGSAAPGAGAPGSGQPGVGQSGSGQSGSGQPGGGFPSAPVGPPPDAAAMADVPTHTGQVALRVGRRRLSCTLVLAVAGALAVATTTAVFLLPDMFGSSSSGDHSGARPTSSETTDNADSGERGQVPEGYLGTWQGAVTTQGGLPAGELSVTFREGSRGEEVAELDYTAPGGVKCYGIGVLVSADDRKLVLEERADTERSAGEFFCSTATAKVTFVRKGEEVLNYSSDDDGGGRPTGQLIRSSS